MTVKGAHLQLEPKAKHKKKKKNIFIGSLMSKCAYSFMIIIYSISEFTSHTKQ